MKILYSALSIIFVFCDAIYCLLLALADGKGASRGRSLGLMGPHTSLSFLSSSLSQKKFHIYS